MEALGLGDLDVVIGRRVGVTRDDKLIAADCVGRPKEFMASKQLITKGLTPELSSLTDEQVEPASWLK